MLTPPRPLRYARSISETDVKHDSNSASVPEPSVTRVTLLLFGITGVGFLPWFALSALGPTMIRDLEASAALPGRLIGMLFLAAAVVSAVVGPSIDRFGTVPVVRGAFVVCALSLGAMALAPSVPLLMAAVGVAGIALAVPMPATASVVARRVAAPRRGAVIGVAQSGQQVGALLAGLALPWLAVTAGWRASLMVAAGVAVLVGVTTTRGWPRAGVPGGLVGSNDRGRAPVWLLLYAGLMSTWTVSGVAFLPVTAAEVHAFDPRVAGSLVTVIGGVAILGKIGWGRAAGNASRATTPALVLAMVAMVGLTVAALSDVIGPAAMWIAAVILGSSSLAWPVVTLALVARGVSSHRAGAVSGQVLAGGFIGSATGPVAFGMVLERFGFAAAWWTGVGVTLTAAAVLGVASRVTVFGTGENVEASGVATDDT